MCFSSGSPGWVGGNDRPGADRHDLGAEMIGIEGGVAQDPFGRQAVDQGRGLGHVVTLAGGEQTAHRQA